MSNQVYFEDIETEIVRLLRSSTESVKICVAWISGAIYTPILTELANKGISIELVYDNNSTNLNYGVPSSPLYKTYPINTRIASSLMHNKFCIIDSSTIITGSYNWSQKAKDSFENIVVIKNDYKLIKRFLHEFYDLINYFNAFSSNQIERCHCGSHLYNLGIMGQESGLYDESKIDIWKVCVKNQHVTHLGEEYENHLQTHLGMKYEPDFDIDYYDKSLMLTEFQQEQSRINSLQQYFSGRAGEKIHAVGIVAIDNWNGHIEWKEEPKYIVNIFWRDMFYRKIIPHTLYDDPFGGVDQIIRDHM